MTGEFWIRLAIGFALIAAESAADLARRLVGYSRPVIDPDTHDVWEDDGDDD